MIRLQICLGLVVSLLAATASWAESIDIGPKVGTKIPELVGLRDESAAAKGFNDVAGEKGVVIAFMRSADWCPFCQVQLKELKTIAEPLAKKGFRLVTISYDEPEVLARFKTRNEVPYTLLSDKGSVVIDAFGIRDPQYKQGSKAFGVPQPVIFIVDRSGIVRAKLAEEGFKTRPSPEAVMAATTGALEAK